jgi:hypothetical protein
VQTLINFDGQNWLITPSALARGEAPPATIRDQKWLVNLTGVIEANFKGNSSSQWRNDTVSFLPDMALDQHGNSAGPLAYAISHYGIPTPPPGQFEIGFTLEQGAPYVSLSAIYDQAQSIDAGYAVNVWRPNHFDTRTDFFTNQPVGNLFTGINADIGVRDTDGWILKLNYNAMLLGRIVFLKPIIIP